MSTTDTAENQSRPSLWLSRAVSRAVVWGAFDRDFKASALECCDMIEHDAEVRRRAECVAAADALKDKARNARALEGLIAKKLLKLMSAREAGPRLHLSKPHVEVIAHVCAVRRRVIAVCRLSWRGKECRQSVECSFGEGA